MVRLPLLFYFKRIVITVKSLMLSLMLKIVLSGVHPFDLQGMSTDQEIENRIKSDPRAPIHPQITGHLSDSAIDLIKKLMEPDPDRRLSANGMLKHPWIRGDTARTTKMMNSDKKLMKYKDLKDKLEAGIFSVLISQVRLKRIVKVYTLQIVNQILIASFRVSILRIARKLTLGLVCPPI